jgi:hypothetical protein
VRRKSILPWPARFPSLARANPVDLNQAMRKAIGKSKSSKARLSIQGDDWIIFDTNVWIFGLRRVPHLPACAELLQNLNRLWVALPRQILQELQANLVDDELRALFRLKYSQRWIFFWKRTQRQSGLSNNFGRLWKDRLPRTGKLKVAGRS